MARTARGDLQGRNPGRWNCLLQILGWVEICREAQLWISPCFLQTATSVTIAKGLSALPEGRFQGFTPCCRLKLGKQDGMPEGIYCLTCLNINMIKQKLDDFINYNLIKG